MITHAKITDYRFLPMRSVPSVLWIWVQLSEHETTLLEFKDSAENLKRRFGMAGTPSEPGSDFGRLVDKPCELRKGPRSYSLVRILSH